MSVDIIVGTWVKPSLVAGDDLPVYRVAEIYSDWFGQVALMDSGGYGYGFQYLTIVSQPE
jgi:hypothetical protein